MNLLNIFSRVRKKHKKQNLLNALFDEKSFLKAEKNRDNTLTFYAVVAYDESLEEGGLLPEDVPLLTIVPTFIDAAEYVAKAVYKANEDHFTAWCNYQNFDPKAADSWKHYCSTVLDFSDKKNLFTVISLRYKYKDLAAICRIFERCKPIGCSFDDPREESTSVVKKKSRISPKPKKTTPANGDDPSVFSSVVQDSTKNNQKNATKKLDK